MVLTYHSVGPTPLGLREQRFQEQMRWLHEHAAVVSLDSLLSGDHPRSRSGVTCAITFDDGYASVYKWAFPVLRELNFPALVYLVASAIGVDEPMNSNDFNGLYPEEKMLLWREVREMQDSHVSVGSHLMQHKDLTSLDSIQARHELEGSKKVIEDRTGLECRSFCYPWGKHDARCVQQVKDAGYKNAVIAVHGHWKKREELDPYRIPRADIRKDYSIEDFAAIVGGEWDYLGVIQKLRAFPH